MTDSAGCEREIAGGDQRCARTCGHAERPATVPIVERRTVDHGQACDGRSERPDAVSGRIQREAPPVPESRRLPAVMVPEACAIAPLPRELEVRRLRRSAREDRIA